MKQAGECLRLRHIFAVHEEAEMVSEHCWCWMVLAKSGILEKFYCSSKHKILFKAC